MESLFESSPLTKRVRKDLESNKKMKKAIEDYWRALGHEIEVFVQFNEKLNVYELRSDDLKNGRPKGALNIRSRQIVDL